jgi:hypothetical protein
MCKDGWGKGPDKRSHSNLSSRSVPTISVYCKPSLSASHVEGHLQEKSLDVAGIRDFGRDLSMHPQEEMNARPTVAQSLTQLN